MEKIIKKLQNSENIEKIIIITALIILIYLISSLYFSNHFFFNTVINGVDVSLKDYDDADEIIRDFVQDYQLLIIERNNKSEVISGQDICLQYHEDNNIFSVYKNQDSLKWIISLFRNDTYYINDLFSYQEDCLNKLIDRLDCFNTVIVEPRSVKFIYANGSYEMLKEEYGNKIIKDKLVVSIIESVLKGKRSLDLNNKLCYENPRFTIHSEKALLTKDLLNQYVSTKIFYIFGKEMEVLDGNIINRWLRVDDKLDVVISEAAVNEYIKVLGNRYDTVGITRTFTTSTGKTVEVEGGLYGWKIDRKEEVKALIENIYRGDVKEKEPIYSQRAFSREGNEIGNTYIELNITKQYLWFYKNGKLIAGGYVVTGNPNKGNATVLGTYSVIYKQRDAILTGPNYDVEVSYWIPFFGSIGIHDATWRYHFGGEIYKRRGSHGCVNAPYSLAKKIYENIEEGTPVISYEE
jgi:hypothetical protein